MIQVTYAMIPGFPGHRAGSDGTIWTAWQFAGGCKWFVANPPNWKLMKPSCGGRDSRRHYELKSNGKVLHRNAGHWILLAFVGTCPEGMEACHNDGDNLNDCLDNLRWDTHAANITDRGVHGGNATGDKNGMAKLDWPTIREIRRCVASGEHTKSEMARRTGMNKSTIGRIVAEITWKEPT